MIEHLGKGIKKKTIRKFILGFILALILLMTIAFTYGYFHYSKVLKSLIVESVTKESKGLYHTNIGNIYLNVLSGNLIISDLELIPDTAYYLRRMNLDTLAPILFKLKISRFIVNRFRVLDALFNHELKMTEIRLVAPEISAFRMQIAKHSADDHTQNKLMSVPLPKRWNLISIHKIAIENGKLDYYDLSGDTMFHQTIPSCSIHIKNILVDSVHQGKKRLFNADDISIKLDSISFRTKNGLNVLSFGEIGLSTGLNQLYIRNFHLIPQYNHFDYSRKFGFQTDRMEISIGLIRCSRLNIRELILNKKVSAGLLEIDSLVLDDYRDKRIGRKPGFKPPMPQDGLRRLRTYLKIDTVLLKNGKAGYSEQVNDQPGTIFFNKMEAIMTGLTNDSAVLQSGLVSELKGTAFVMGEGKIDITLRFNLGDKNNSFTCSAKVSAFNLKVINPMLSRLLPAEIISGKVKQLIIPQIVANDDIASGNLVFYYNDLEVSLKTEKKSTWNSIKKGVINFVANDIIVSKDNPTKAGKLKSGVILFKRDKEKGFINFLWKSTLSGLKSTMGFDSKEQKEIIKKRTK